MRRLSCLAIGLTFAFVAPHAFAAQGDGDAAKGQALFERKCAICHDVTAAGKNAGGKPGPGLKGVKDGKLPSGKPTSYENVMETLMNGGGGMPSYKDEKMLSSEEKDHVIAYVTSL